MKKLIIVLVIVLGFGSLARGEPPVREVEVVNVPLNVNIQNQPVNVNVVKESQSYEYVVLRVENSDAWGAVEDFQTTLNTYASEGWELVSFAYKGITEYSPSYEYHAIMRMPKQ